MAENDIELSVGIKIDEAQFLNSYNSFINKTATETQQQVQSALDSTKGAATKQWGPLPYASMHDATSGASAATKAFLPSFASDLAASGYATDSLAYQSALINAAYRSSMADPMQRYHKMLSMGLMQQADLTHPDTPLGKAIETDYALMSQPWSRDFIRAGQQEVLSADELGKMSLKALRAKASTMGLKGLSGKKKADVISAMVAKSQEPTLGFDFAGMREYAVDAGLGRWIDDESSGVAGTNTADNFELINDELEEIEDKSKKSEKTFLGWNDTLKGVLGTLTAIGSLAGIVKTFEVAYKASEAGTVAAGTTLDKRRAFIGMSALDELKTKVASKSVGLGEDSIKNEIYTMSGNIEQYKLMGQGDALPSALLGIFDNLMSAEDPYSVYTQSADELYKQLQGADAQTRRRWLMLMNKAGLGSMSSLVGQFLSNPEYAKQYGTPSALFNLKSNPYYGVYPEAETMLPQISQLNESLKASYSTMYKDWEKAFGLPFKEWWDATMKDKVIPWFEKVISFLGLNLSPAEKEAANAVTDLSMILLSSDRDSAIAKAVAKNDAIAAVPGYKAQTGPLAYHSAWGSWFGGQVNQTGRAANAIWTLYGQVADYSDEEINSISDLRQRTATRNAIERIRKMRKKLESVGLSHFLEDTKSENIDTYLLRAMQVGAYSNSPNWESNFDSYIDSILKLGLRGQTDDKIIALLETIAANTEVSEALTKNKDFWDIITLQYGSAVANDWKEKLTNR